MVFTNIKEMTQNGIFAPKRERTYNKHSALVGSFLVSSGVESDLLGSFFSIKWGCLVH